MVGILKLNKIIAGVLIIFLITSCKERLLNQEKFIADNFINIVDTMAYTYGSFRAMPPLPNDTIKREYSYSNLSLYLNNKIKINVILQKEIDAFFNSKHNLKMKFLDVINNGNYSDIELSPKFPKKIGKYDIFFIKDNKITESNYAGEVEISNLKIYEDKAYLIVTKSFNKSTVAYIVLFIKEDNIWQMVERELLLVS